MDPTIWAAAVGGLITAVPAVWAVIASNRASRKMAADAEQDARNRAERQILLARIGTIKMDLRHQDRAVQMDALDELERLLPAVTHDLDRRWVWSILDSRMARQVRQYPEEGSEIRFVPPTEPPERQG